MPKRKKMAQGGEVNESAASERRPMPEETDKDSAMVSRNSGNKPPGQDSWTGRPTVTQAQSNSGRSVKTIKYPKMVPSSVMNTKLLDQEDDFQDSMSPSEPTDQPSKIYDEEDIRQSSANPDMADTHSTKRKPYAEGGKINDYEPFSESEDDGVEHPAGLEEDNDQMRPPMSDYMYGKDGAAYEAEGGMLDAEDYRLGDEDDEMEPEMMANGGDPDSRTDKGIDYTNQPDKGYGAIIFKAEGGSIDHEMMDQPEDEYNTGHEASVAAAIMAKRKAGSMSTGSSDYDKAAMYAEGGEVDLDENSREQPNGYYPRNEDEVLRENYDSDFTSVNQPNDSNAIGDVEEENSENEHDRSVVTKIRSKMKNRSPISR